mgnify:CR=1 FL=1
MLVYDTERADTCARERRNARARRAKTRAQVRLVKELNHANTARIDVPIPAELLAQEEEAGAEAEAPPKGCSSFHANVKSGDTLKSFVKKCTLFVTS